MRTLAKIFGSFTLSLAVVFALFALGFVTGAIGADGDRGSVAAGCAILAAMFALPGGLALRWATRHERAGIPIHDDRPRARRGALDAPRSAPSSAGEPVHCSTCGTVGPPTSAGFCAVCGARLEREAVQSPRAHETS
jgi:hypothetical protein